jgi:hypothetical protein
VARQDKCICTVGRSCWPPAQIPCNVHMSRGICWRVTSRANKDEFEPASGPSVSSMTCVASCPTLLVEGEPHQHINPSAKCISTPPVNPFTRNEDESVSGVRASRTEPYLELGCYNWY